MKKQIINKIIVVVVIVLIILYICMPHAKMRFKSYEEFNGRVFEFFPESLPKSASDVKYYEYSGIWGKKYALAITLDDEDYCDMKNKSENYFMKIRNNNEEIKGGNNNNDKFDNRLIGVSDNYVEYIYNTKYCYNIAVNDDILNNKHYSFLEKTAIEDLNNYSVVGYVQTERTSDIINYAILINDETKRILYFYYFCP